jgi:hypothetical protein
VKSILEVERGFLEDIADPNASFRSAGCLELGDYRSVVRYRM